MTAAAGPLGAIAGSAVGGAVGGVNGALGVNPRYHRHTARLIATTSTIAIITDGPGSALLVD